jgi:hypothetical protein
MKGQLKENRNTSQKTTQKRTTKMGTSQIQNDHKKIIDDEIDYMLKAYSATYTLMNYRCEWLDSEYLTKTAVFYLSCKKENIIKLYVINIDSSTVVMGTFEFSKFPRLF